MALERKAAVGGGVGKGVGGQLLIHIIKKKETYHFTFAPGGSGGGGSGAAPAEDRCGARENDRGHRRPEALLK